MLKLCEILDYEVDFLKKANPKNYEPSCSYCVFGNESPFGTEILCVKMGIRAPSSFCKKFAYDPLKRNPRKAPTLPKFEKGDFEL